MEKKRKKSELETIIFKNNDTKKEIAKALNLTEKTIINKLKKNTFKCEEIRIISSRYNLSDEEIVNFFKLKSN